MTKDKISLYQESIVKKIFKIRDRQVMLDFHLAELYDVETKYLNRAVKRNPSRFPESFMFRITKEDYEDLKLQNGASKDANSLRFQTGTLETGRGKHRKYLPYAFTEQGVAMLSAVLNSETAIATSIKIMEAFVEMRHFLISNAQVFQRLEKIEFKQAETDSKVQILFNAMERKQLQPKQGIFFEGQVYDAWEYVSRLVKSATKRIILIDNYVDETTLNLMTKKRAKVSIDIYTRSITARLKTDAEKFNAQYGKLNIHRFRKSHDRFLIVDDETYHIGASLKDLGKKWFAFSKMEKEGLKIFEKLGI